MRSPPAVYAHRLASFRARRGGPPAISSSRARNPLIAVACFLLIGPVGACDGDGPPDPRTYPARLSGGQQFGHAIRLEDLDGDGRDEVVRYYRLDRPPYPGVVSLWSQSYGAIEQLNYPGRVLEPHFLDLEDDGLPELAVPLVRNDSLFVSFANGRGKKLFSFFLTSGQPREEPEGELGWDPSVVDLHLLDVDHDGQRELITVVLTGYARMPRGVFVHRMPDGELVGKRIIGAPIWASVLDDFDGDGKPRLLVNTWAINNGARAGGFDDAHSYVILFEFTPAPEIVWAEEKGGRWWGTNLARGDFDGDGRSEFLVASVHWGRESHERARFEIVEPGSWRTVRRFASAEPLSPPVVVDLDRDARPELISVRYPSQIWVLDSDFALLSRKTFGPRVSTSDPVVVLPDLDEDGSIELAVNMREGFSILDSDLTAKAFSPKGRVTGVMRRGVGVRPALIVRTGEGNRVAQELVANPLFWLYRYGPPALAILAAVLASLAGVWLVRARRRRRLMGTVYAKSLESLAVGHMLLDRRGRVRWANDTLRSWLGKACDDLDDVAGSSPALSKFCGDALAAPVPERRTESIWLPHADDQGSVHVSAEPLMVGIRGDPHWLVRLREARDAANPEGTWAMMAQRVAHSVKNPLTSILLTLQRLEMEYRERAPAIANRLDHYATRIEDQIEELRQLTNNFLKFVDVEKPDLEETDLNELVQDFAEPRQRTMPPDIRLQLKLEPNLPKLALDREQIRSLLDNLVTNALNAMPEGGRITISTTLAEGVSLPIRPAAHDYVELEVLDTGLGIPEEEQEELFEPGFTKDGGSGLGLAIVRKIVRDHGGEIMVESEVGTGTVFSAYLPVRHPSQSRSATGTGTAQTWNRDA